MPADYTQESMRRTQRAKPFETSKDRSVESKRAYCLSYEMLKKFKLVSFLTYGLTGVRTWENGALDVSRQYFKVPLPGQILYKLILFNTSHLSLSECFWDLLYHCLQAGHWLLLHPEHTAWEGYKAIFVFRRN